VSANGMQIMCMPDANDPPPVNATCAYEAAESVFGLAGCRK
jgi:hypothetical protein